MNTFELGIWRECTKCTFYSVTFAKEDPNLEISEVDKFLEYYENNETFEECLLKLHYHIVNDIGEVHGALPIFFNRPENEVKGLPLHGEQTVKGAVYHFPKFDLRLYALWISEGIVILFNGGVKDGPTNQESSLNLKWKEACAIAKRIQQALDEEEIITDFKNRKLLNHLSEEGITL